LIYCLGTQLLTLQMFSLQALTSMALLTGAEVPTGADTSQLYVDTYLHGGQEKTEIQKQAEVTSHTLDAACSF